MNSGLDWGLLEWNCFGMRVGNKKCDFELGLVL